MDDITQKLLNAIKNTYEKEISSNSLIKEITSKIKKGNANYEDMLKYSKELGICLSKAFQKNISDEVLPDSKMYYNIAKSLVEPMCKENYKTIASHCAAVQTSLNQKAGIGIKGIKPTYKEEKTEGIINYISNASKYSEREKSFLQSLSTNAKSIVDDSVKENADFHFKSGLSPKIIRRTSGKTCKWCQNLAGVYDYANVSTTRSDVFRRHANCDCVVVYDPSDGSKKVQDVWSKKWNDNSKLDIVQNRLENIQKKTKLNLPKGIEDVTKKYISEATPNKGNIIIDEEVKKEDISIGEWLHKTYGGNIHLLQEDKVIKWPDAYWKNEFWEFKTPVSANSIDKRIRKAVSQLNSAKSTTDTTSKSSGIVLDISNFEVNNNLLNLIVEKFSKRSKGEMDLIIKKNEKTILILRSKKR